MWAALLQLFSNHKAPAVQLRNAKNWRGKPLVSHQAIVNLIASTTTQAGLIRGQIAIAPPSRHEIIALAVWNVRPVAFAEYHNWLMDPPDPPSLADARRRATELIGRDALENALGSERIDRQVGDGARIYHSTGQNAIPTLLVKGFVLIGAPSTTDKLCEALEQHGAFDK